MNPEFMKYFLRIQLLWVIFFRFCKTNVNDANIAGDTNCNTNNGTIPSPCYQPITNASDDNKPTEMEDSDKFAFHRIQLGLSPSLTKILQTNPVKYYDMKIAFAYRFLIQKQRCNFTEFKATMPQFWNDYVGGTADFNELENFRHRYWNVSVKFKHNDKIATVEGHCGHRGLVENCTVDKNSQLKRQQDLCFSGSLLECSGATKTCTCLTSHGTKTIRVDTKTGNPDPNGKACFVVEGYPCFIRHYGKAHLRLPCAYKNLCSSFTGLCQGVRII